MPQDSDHGSEESAVDSLGERDVMGGFVAYLAAYIGLRTDKGHIQDGAPSGGSRLKRHPCVALAQKAWLNGQAGSERKQRF